MDIKRAKQQVYSGRRRARTYDAVITLTYQEWMDILNKSNGYCAYCSRNIGIDHLELEHQIPLSIGGSHSADNVVAACARCNTKKNANPPDPKFNAPDLPFLDPEGLYTAFELGRPSDTFGVNINKLIDSGNIVPVGISTKCRRALLFDQSAKDYITKSAAIKIAQDYFFKHYVAQKASQLSIIELVVALEEKGYKVTIEKIKDSDKKDEIPIDTD